MIFMGILTGNTMVTLKKVSGDPTDRQTRHTVSPLRYIRCNGLFLLYCDNKAFLNHNQLLNYTSSPNWSLKLVILLRYRKKQFPDTKCQVKGQSTIFEQTALLHPANYLMGYRYPKNYQNSVPYGGDINGSNFLMNWNILENLLPRCMKTIF